jgi:hypothetical protein
MDHLDTTSGLRGYLTECDLPAAERSFPGIGAFYLGSAGRFTTFLELVWAFLDQPCASSDRLR